MKIFKFMPKVDLTTLSLNSFNKQHREYQNLKFLLESLKSLVRLRFVSPFSETQQFFEWLWTFFCLLFDSVMIIWDYSGILGLIFCLENYENGGARFSF